MPSWPPRHALSLALLMSPEITSSASASSTFAERCRPPPRRESRGVAAPPVPTASLNARRGAGAAYTDVQRSSQEVARMAVKLHRPGSHRARRLVNESKVVLDRRDE